MIVETHTAQKSGEGTSMYSRPGKSTSVQYMVFSNPSSNPVESTFAKEKREKKGSKHKPMEMPELDPIFEILQVCFIY